MDFSFIDDWEEEAGKAIEEAGEGYRNIWVLAETVSPGKVGAESLHPATLQVFGAARDMADQIGVYVYGVLLGSGVASLGEKLFAYGADKVLVADDPALGEYLPGLYAQILSDLVGQYRPEIVLMPATSLGNDLAPRLAQRLDTGLISHCVKVEMDMSERLLLGTFAVLGGEMYHTVACPEARPQMATLQPGYFRIPYEDTSRSGQVEKVDLTLQDVSSRLVWADMDVACELPAVPLSKAKIVVSAGRGMEDANGFALVEQLAKALGGMVAGSRGAFDEGWITEEQIVGVGGESIAPDLYVACGVSGDIYHYFGLQNAKFVVAINSDESAPIMKIANVAVVGDAKQVIPAMLEALAT
ncbi:MAG TPA: electron transfer flavoprotein subunit alpha/FixB family protein [Anaerolineae bacterium]|nr:electron transfer flavoprotein subunit alpha/FixB family protein [Anaerolineae bacterium]